MSQRFESARRLSFSPGVLYTIYKRAYADADQDEMSAAVQREVYVDRTVVG